MSSPEELAFHFNLSPVRGRREWRGDCPACGYASGLVLSHREGRALLWCASCQDRDAMAALLRVAGGGGPVVRCSTPPRPSTGQQRSTRARAIWESTCPLHGTPAASYLDRRGLASLCGSPALRFHPEALHPSGLRLPALVALVQAVDGRAVGVHRTYLQADGQKAAVVPQKATLGLIQGGAIRLKPPAPEIVVGEGIESSGSAGLMLSLPAWAAISAGNLSALLLPPEVQAVLIAADHDANGVGQHAAEQAAMRWRAEGRRVRIATPNKPGCDFNDIAMEAAHG